MPGFNPSRMLAATAGFKRPFQVGCFVALLAWVVTAFLPNIYRSEAHILPVNGKSSSTGLGNLLVAASAFGVNLLGEGTDNNFVDVLNSRSMRERLLWTEFDFNWRTWPFGTPRKRHETLYNLLEPKNLERGVRRLGKMFVATRDPKSGILTIRAETRSPELSQQIVQRAAKYLEAIVLEKGRTRGGNKADFSAARLSDAKAEMAEAERDFSRFLQNNRNYQVSMDPTIRLTGLRLEAELKLRQQLVLSMSMNYEQALLEEKNDIPILTVLDPANLPEEKTRPMRLEMVLSSFVLAACGSLAWKNRLWIKSAILEEAMSKPYIGSKDLAQP